VTSNSKKNAEEDIDSELIWACDYCYFIYYKSNSTRVAKLELYSLGQANENFMTLAEDDDGDAIEGGYNVSTKHEALEEGLDVLYLNDVPLTYFGKDMDGEAYGSYGNNPEWIKAFKERYKDIYIP